MIKALLTIAVILVLQGCSAYELWFGGKQPLMSTIIIKNEVPKTIGGYSESDQQDSRPSEDISSISGTNYQILSELGFGEDEYTKLQKTDPAAAKKILTLAEKYVVEKKTMGYLITWSPEYNGAFVTSSGHGCIQPAMYARTENGSLDLPTELFTKIAGTGQVSAEYTEAIDKLIAVTDQTTFLSIGTYGICQLAAIGKLTDQQASNLMTNLFTQAATLRNGAMATNQEPASLEEETPAVASIADE